MDKDLMRLALKASADKYREIADKIEKAYEDEAPAITLLVLWPDLDDAQKRLGHLMSMIATK